MTLPGCFALAFCAWSRTEGICSDEFKSESGGHWNLKYLLFSAFQLCGNFSRINCVLLIKSR